MNTDSQVIIFVANNEFQDEEFNVVKEELESADIGIKIVAPEKDECHGVNGTIAEPDYTSDEVNADDFLGVVYIGGPGTDKLLDHTGAQELAITFAKAGKVVAAICWAPAILAKAGVLQGKRATVWSGAKDDLIKGGSQYTAELVTVDGNIVTADSPDSAGAFGQAIAKIIADMALQSH